MITLESAVFLLVYAAAAVAAWLATYCVHSTVLIGGLWLLNRVARWPRPTRELSWKVALVGGVATATISLATDMRPLLGRFETASFVAARTWDRVTASPPQSGKSPLGSAEGRAVPSSLTFDRSASRHRALDLERFAARLPGAATALRYVPLALVLAWLIRAAVVLLRVGTATARARRALGAREGAPGEAAERFQAVARSMGLSRPVRFTISERLASPVALGRSEITVPRRLLTDLCAEDQWSVVAHEVAHLVRRDPWWLLAAATTESLFFFQPLNRMARMRWQEQAEYLCDERVARVQGSGLPLARALARVAEWLSTEVRLLAPAFAETSGTLLGRVRALIGGGVPEPPVGRRARTALWVAPALVLCGPPSFAPGSVGGWGTAAFHWSGAVPAGQTLEVQGVLGSIRVEPSEGDQVEVYATRHGRSTNPDVHFEVLRHSGGVTICAIYPVDPTTPRVVPPSCTPGAPVQSNTPANDVEIEFVVDLPRGVDVRLSTAVGDVTTGPLRGSVEARSGSGDIEITTTEHASAETRSGDVRVSMGQTRWNGSLRLSTLSGDVRLALPAESSVELSATTRTGTIRSDFDLGRPERVSWGARRKPSGSVGTSVHGVIGEGGRELKLETLSGNVVVKRR